MRVTFQAEPRTLTNKTGLKRLRKDGRLPGIIFGANAENVMIHLSRSDFQRWTRTNGTGIVYINIEGQDKIPVLLEDIHRDPLTNEYLHVDFLRVQQDEVVRTKLLVDFVGTAAGTKEGGIIQIQSNLIEVEALPAKLPDSITFDISELEVGQSVFVGDLKLPEGVTLVSADNELLISVITPRVS